MNSFKFDIHNVNNNFEEICGTKIKYKVTFYNEDKFYPLTKGDLIEAFIEHMNVDKMCQYYGLNKYYLAGDYETNRILECCIMPIKYKFSDKTNYTNEGYLVFYNFCTDFKHHPVLISAATIPLFIKTLYDNPNDAGKEYITNKLDTMYDVYCHNEEFIDNYENHFDDMIQQKREELENYYHDKLETDIKEYENLLNDEYDSKFDVKQHILNYYNDNIKYAKILNLDLTKYGKIIHYLRSGSKGQTGSNGEN